MKKGYRQLTLLSEEQSLYEADSQNRVLGQAMKIYTKQELIAKLREIRDAGWIRDARPGNVGGVGNTLEDLLGIKENNLPMPNAGEWQLKARRETSSSLTTLFHTEPSPTALEFVTQVFLPKYGWPHKHAGEGKIPKDCFSFRQTINTLASDRGFRVIVDTDSRKVLISFDARKVDRKHSEWLRSVASRAGLAELDPQPYWGSVIYMLRLV